MRFIKGFKKSDPKETIQKKLLELNIGEKAVYLPQEIDKEDEFHLVREVASDLIEAEQLNGILIGKKGWFLPKGTNKLENIWSSLHGGKLDLSVIAKEWGLNEKRVYIALEGYAESKGLSDPIFYRDELDLYLMSYFRQAWIDTLAKTDPDEIITYEQLLKTSPIKSEDRELLNKFATDWIKEEASQYSLTQEGKVVPKIKIPELIAEFIPEAWEQGNKQITYFELAEKYGITTREVERMLLKLIDDKLVTEVTLWATDELIKPQI